MTENEKASADAVVRSDGSPTPEEDKQTPTPDEPDERKLLADKLAIAGRELKSAREAAAKAEANATEEKAKREELWYKHAATEDEKADYRKSREADVRDGSKLASLLNRASLLEAIADEDNPQTLRALKALKARSDISKKYPDSDTVAALRESFVIDDNDEGKGTELDSEKVPVAVTASRGTQGVQPSLDDQVKEAEQSVKAKDGRFSYGNLLGLRQQAQMAKDAAKRG